MEVRNTTQRPDPRRAARRRAARRQAAMRRTQRRCAGLLVSTLAIITVLGLLSKSHPSAGGVTVPPIQTEVLPTLSPTQPTEPMPTRPPYDYSQSVPESNAVQTDYFDDAVFIGDSRTEGLMINTGLSNAAIYASKGLMVDTAFTSPVINCGGKMVSVMEALRTTEFAKVYIMLGINETGWISSSYFIEKYSGIIDAIREVNPAAQIYIQSIPPVSQKVSDSHSYIHNDKIYAYNALLAQMAEEKQVYYLDIASALAPSGRALPDDAADDGIHLNKENCITWLTYLKTHTVTN